MYITKRTRNTLINTQINQGDLSDTLKFFVNIFIHKI